MAGFTSTWRSRCFRLLHALIELPVVRIRMATGATQVGPVVNGRRRLEIGGLLVTIRTRYRYVLAGQKKARFFVARQRESRRTVCLNRMATVARVEIGRRCELPNVLVLMTVGAVLELHFEYRVHTSWDVALFASDFGVGTLQRICGCRVIRDCER